MNKKDILKKALAKARITELEAHVLVMEIFQEAKSESN